MINFFLLLIILAMLCGLGMIVVYTKPTKLSKIVGIVLATIGFYLHYRCMIMGDYHMFSEKFARWFVNIIQAVNNNTSAVDTTVEKLTLFQKILNMIIWGLDFVLYIIENYIFIPLGIIAIGILIFGVIKKNIFGDNKILLAGALLLPLCSLAQQTTEKALPNPMKWAKKQGEVKNIDEWCQRRAEISNLIQKYEIGEIPEVSRDQVSAHMSDDTLFVTVTVGKESLTLSSVITYPTVGEAPYPLLIGSSRISLPDTILKVRPIARMNFNERQVNGYSQFRGDTCRANYGFVRLYPHLIDNGAYSEWAWGFQRIIDGLEILGPEITKIDTKHIGVTGCSYAGKMALFCGAFDPRVALTIAQEPGGGGAAAWRVSHTLTEVEDLDRTDYHWFKHSLREQFHGDSVYQLPYDHHELCALVCPRAFLMLGNTDYKWLADESGYVSVNAARRVWERLGISDRMGYSILGNHPHCMLPEVQYKEVEAFIDRFLLGKEADTRDIRIAPMFKDSVDLSRWIKF